MQEYEDIGHMSRNNEDPSSTEKRYYLPRHSVCNSSNSTSHNRVVFLMAHDVRVTEYV